MMGFIVDMEFVWGFQARVVGLSKTSPSFYYPPPTTFLGALAEAIAKEYHIGEDLGRFIINELSRNLLAIGVRPINCVPIKYEDLNRIITIRRVGVKDKKTGRDIGILAPHPLYLDKSFDSPARGKTTLASLNEDAPKLRWFLIFKDGTINVQDENLRGKIKTIELNDEIFWRIHRLGSKESRVCVTEVKSFQEIKVNSKGYVITKYSFPTSATNFEESEEKVRRWENEVYVNPFGGNIYIREKKGKKSIERGILDKYQKGFENLRVFKIPLIVSIKNLPEYVIKVNNGWKAYSVIFDGIREVIIGVDNVKLPN